MFLCFSVSFPMGRANLSLLKVGGKVVDTANFFSLLMLTHFFTEHYYRDWEDGAENQTPSMSIPDLGLLQQMPTNWSMENWLMAGSLPVCPCRLTRCPVLVETSFWFSFEPLNVPGRNLLKRILRYSYNTGS